MKLFLSSELYVYLQIKDTVKTCPHSEGVAGWAPCLGHREN